MSWMPGDVDVYIWKIIIKLQALRCGCGGDVDGDDGKEGGSHDDEASASD